MLGITIAILIICIFVWLGWRKKQFSVLKEMGIPGPEPSILFGNVLDLCFRSPLVCHKEWAQKYGKIFGYYFGRSPIVLIADPELLKKIQVSDFHKFINRPRIFGNRKTKLDKNDGFSYQLTNLRDKRWKAIRSILTPSFTTSKMRLMAPIINSAIDTLVENIDKNAKKGESFDIYKLYQGLTMDVIGRTAFGIQTDCQNNPDDPFLMSSRALFSGDLTGIMPILSLSFPEFMKVWQLFGRIRLTFVNKGIYPVRQIIDAADAVIKERRKDPSKRRNDLLQLMIDATMTESDISDMSGKDLTATGDDVTEQNEKSDVTKETTPKTAKAVRHMEDHEILHNAILFFLAGYETTSTALAFTTHFLIHYPDIQEKVREEINDLIKREGKLDYSSVHQLQYMDQVLTESLRMYPPIYLFVNREVGEDMSLGQISLKKGTAVQIPAHLLQHDEDFWQNPDVFDPERFSPENKKNNNPLTFQAFGAGPRNCIGMRFAQMEAKLALARVLQKYKLVACKDTDKLELTLKINAAIITPGKGVYLKAIPF